MKPDFGNQSGRGEVMTQATRFVQGESRSVVWRTVVRAGCVALNSQPAWMIGQISTSMRFPGASSEERYQLAQLAQHLAEEYGLRAETTDNGEFIRVKLLRTSADGQAHSGGTQSASGVVPTADWAPSESTPVSAEPAGRKA
jgi:hypothetical protein